MEDGEDRTFRISLAGEGMARLRERVTEKLKEFMGDYTDDTLVDYVLVLLRNGRSKAEARRELNVFLGDDSVSFVSWLWDHLSSNLHLYVEPIEFERETNTQFDDQKETHNLKQEHVAGTVQKIDSEHERERLNTVSRNRRNRDWKGLVRDRTNPFPLRSTVTEILQSEVKNHHRPAGARRSLSPRTQIDRKRSREDERLATKRVAASRPVIGAPRRLLQFAVRDAVRTVQQQSSSRSEPALKRLRSVVSTSTTDSLVDERPQRIRSVARVPGAVSAAFRAAAEAAEDVTKNRCSSVFDRLSHGVATLEPFDQPSNLREPMLEDGECEDSDRTPVSDHVDYYQRSEYDGEFTGDMTMLERDPGVAVDSASDNDGYDDVATGRHQGMDASQSASSAIKDKNSLRLQYSVAQDANEVVRKTRLIDQDPPATTAPTPSSKIVNISVNVNTWKPPQYQVPRDVTEVENRMAVDKTEASVGKTNARLLKENNSAATENENEEMAHTVVQKESQKAVSSTPGSYTTSRPSEDVDSRTVFVSNVHFAATKDALSRHFNKFGEVLKVIIVTDAATGQPKGSAYVEFLRKESAELALSLNGTSFMSRILKVVRRSSAHPESAPMLGWPRIARASPYASRLGRMPFPRGVLGSSAFRARLPIKPGARSLQWKRDTPTAQITAEAGKSTEKSSLVSGNNLQSPTGRNLTYIRPDSKAEGTSGVA